MAFENLEQFNQKLKDFAEREVPEMAEKFFRLIALHILRRVVLKTDVDTGRARGNWQVALNWQPEAEIDRKGEKGPVGRETISAGNLEIGQARLGDVIFITNNVEYVLYLEEGTDKIAPRKMLAESLQEVEMAFRSV